MNKKLITFENIYRIATLLGLAAILWLNSHYVTIEKFDAFQKDQIALHEKIGDTMAAINTSMVLLQTSHETLKDHEMRLRTIEHLVAGGK